MELMDFQPGDRVRYCGSDHFLRNRCGTVVDILLGSHMLVEFDKAFEGGHDGLEFLKCRDGHGWYVAAKEVDLIATAEPECEEALLGSLMELLN